MKSGSFFLAEITRTTSSFRPGGTVSASISLTKPYLYSRLARSSTVFTEAFMAWTPSAVSNGERRTAAAGALNVRVLKNEPRLHQLVSIVELGAAQIQQTLHI